MYEEIIKNNRNSFFALLSDIFPETNVAEDNDFHKVLSADVDKTILEGTGENEWMQEYRMIYNSYVLEWNEFSALEE